MFNNNNIINSTKNSNINAKNIILDDEKEISENRELKKSYTFKIIIIAICLLVYWIILMLIYEKDKKYILDNVDEILEEQIEDNNVYCSNSKYYLSRCA